jgi:hypothetical protein
MNDRDMLELQIAAAPIRDRIPKDEPLPDRISYAMRYVRQHERDLFWMTGKPSDDFMFRTALAAVMLAGSDDDRTTIKESMRPLKALSAAISGVPVDMVAALANAENVIPLLKLWHDSAAAEGEARKG